MADNEPPPMTARVLTVAAEIIRLSDELARLNAAPLHWSQGISAAISHLQEAHYELTHREGEPPL